MTLADCDGKYYRQSKIAPRISSQMQAPQINANRSAFQTTQADLNRQVGKAHLQAAKGIISNGQPYIEDTDCRPPTQRAFSCGFVFNTSTNILKFSLAMARTKNSITLPQNPLPNT